MHIYNLKNKEKMKLIVTAALIATVAAEEGSKCTKTADCAAPYSCAKAEGVDQMACVEHDDCKVGATVKLEGKDYKVEECEPRKAFIKKDEKCEASLQCEEKLKCGTTNPETKIYICVDEDTCDQESGGVKITCLSGMRTVASMAVAFAAMAYTL